MEHHKSRQYINNKSHRRRRKKDAESLFWRIMAKNPPKLRKDMDKETQEVWLTPNRVNSKRFTPRHILKLKDIKTNHKILEISKKKANHYQKKWSSTKLPPGFSEETL